MAARDTNDQPEPSLQAQIAELRAQFEKLVDKGGAAATDAIQGARRVASSELETACHQVRTQPAASALIALAGAAVGFLLGRISR